MLGKILLGRAVIKSGVAAGVKKANRPTMNDTLRELNESLEATNEYLDRKNAQRQEQREEKKARKANKKNPYNNIDSKEQVELEREKLKLKAEAFQAKQQNKSQLQKDIENQISLGIKRTPWKKVTLIYLIVVAALFLISVLCAPLFLGREDSAEQAKCESLEGGVYGGGKCYVNGEER